MEFPETPDTYLPNQRLKVVKYKRTCLAFPAQWEATLDDGRMIYVRFRGGWFSVQVSDGPTTDSMDAVGGQEIIATDAARGEVDEMMETRVIELTKAHVEWPKEFGAREIKVGIE